MSDVISTRMKKKEIEELNKISKKEHVDRSALMRKFLLKEIKEFKLKEVSEQFRKGIVSLAEASTIANVSIYEMMEYCRKEMIVPPIQTSEEIQEEIDQAHAIFEKI